MPDQSRLQVRANNAENTWEDVGNKAGNESVPVNLTGSSTTTPLPVLFAEYSLNNWDDTDPDETYLGSENKSGEWLVVLINETAGTMQYASIVNNVSVTTYASAWTNRTTLTYELYSEA